ncbi:hypothetical protein LJR235_005053 [Pararhizobium sp. LjRoot235]|uniref:hypothetical protein n=1 Tax=Pararhizobium sp. LjRoot235 TaxID=3342291 RepID=UPI003ECE6084
MTLRISVLAIMCLTIFAASVWSNKLQIETSALPSKFAFAGIELLRGDERGEVEGLRAETLETYSRPLFSENRRPYQATVKTDMEPALRVMVEEEPPILELERPQLKLLGTEHTSQLPSALIALEETGTSSWFRKGELVVGWRITRIGTDDIELSNENDANVSFNISLYPDK